MTNKCVVVGVTGCIAAYKTCEIVSRLKKAGYGVKVIMTENATEFVAPLTFETLSKNRVILDMFAEKKEYEVEHISLAREGKLFLIAPATANIISKLANGIADDMLSTTVLATKSIKVLCPAMNSAMYENEVTQKNLARLKELGYVIVEPDSGMLACGEEGKGRLAEPEHIFSVCDKLLTPKPDFRGKRVLITAGGTKEPIDKVRFIGNHSSGKMGIALANAVLNRGGEVTLVLGSVSVSPPKGAKVLYVATTMDMYKAVLSEMVTCDVIIKAAAPADYRVENYSEEKLKSEELTLKLVKNPDIAMEVGKRKGNRKLVVFAAETNDLLKNAAEKLKKKNADFIVANDVTKEGAGFAVDTNIVTIIDKKGIFESLPMMTKEELADIILDKVYQ